MSSHASEDSVSPGPKRTATTAFAPAMISIGPVKLGLSAAITIGLLLGVACGLFLGDYCASLSIVGDAFVGLLRMTVLPYIGVSLIANLGRLSLADSRRLSWVGGLTIGLLWLAALALIAILTLTFPTLTTGAFFSSALIESGGQTDLFSYFVPENIFHSLSENQVPAIIVFCICAGLALSTIPNRQKLITQLDIVSALLLKVSGFITLLAPIGVFAIAASTAGTVSFDELIRLQAYLVAYTAGALFLGLLVLPLLVTTVTPLTYRQVFGVMTQPAITAFGTGKLIVVLPMLIQNTERLLAEISPEGDDLAPTCDVLYATAYPFPHVGKLLSMLFIPFAAWYVGDPMQWNEFPSLFTTGVFSFFGGPIVAIPYLLDQAHLPHDLFQLYLLSGTIGERIGDAVGAVHLTTFTLISIFAFRRQLLFNASALLKDALLIIVVGLLIFGGVRTWLGSSISNADDRSHVLSKLQLIERPVQASVIETPSPNPSPLMPGETILERIRRRKAIRIGYNEDKLPFAFFNLENRLVGYDMDMAHALARDLDVRIEFVRFEHTTLVSQLRDDHFDIIMSGLVGTLERAEEMQHTSGYLDVNLALVVPDYRAREFQTVASIREMSNLRIGFVDLSRGFVDRVRRLMPEAEFIEIEKNKSFFNDNDQQLDSLMVSAESGSAFTLMFPDFEVVVPPEIHVKLPLFYGIGNRDAEMRDFMEHWIMLREKDGTVEEFYDHWILGKTASIQPRRWSVIRNVLQWVD
ncbi:cation:dicarboxylate symporter family transporter [Planctomycetes bacterium K23_9]|uniref:Proton glutamate symport protein n=1 Tax=Stieleria marina TaxID=1930275 RepID=A0A517NPI4_9BACT|nr:Proton glutamate symport protein [Planctomycetes bacterium K23_9]